MIIFRYKWRTGFIAWAVHRLTGIALTLYLFVHLYVLSNLRNPDKFESMMGVLQNSIVKVGELGLLALVVAHAFNGARVTMLELGMPTRMQKPVFWGGAVCFALLLTIGGFAFFGGGH